MQKKGIKKDPEAKKVTKTVVKETKIVDKAVKLTKDGKPVPQAKVDKSKAQAVEVKAKIQAKHEKKSKTPVKEEKSKAPVKEAAKTPAKDEKPKTQANDVKSKIQAKLEKVAKTQADDEKADEDDYVPDESNMTAFQLKDRKQKTCFVGNLPLDMTAKVLRNLFNKFGKVDKIWFRSVATIMDSKLPVKAKIIMKEYSEQKNSKNAYILFDSVEQAK
jgi:RNA recognition motif-containing protein